MIRFTTWSRLQIALRSRVRYDLANCRKRKQVALLRHFTALGKAIENRYGYDPWRQSLRAAGRFGDGIEDHQDGARKVNLKAICRLPSIALQSCHFSTTGYTTCRLLPWSL